MKNNLLVGLLLALVTSACSPQVKQPLNNIKISEIQGCSHESPYVGQKVYGVEGVVTHKFSNGFTMQSIDNDSQDCSSEALFVMTGEYPSVYPGQFVAVDGVVNEYSAGDKNDHNLSRTELDNPKIKIIKEKASFPNPITLGKMGTVPMNFIKQSNEFDIHENGLDYYESLEFMLVEISSGIVVGPKNTYNEFFVLPDEYIKENNISELGALNESQLDQNPEKILIDTASSFTQKVTVGDHFEKPIVGILDYSFGNYKIWTISSPVIDSHKTLKVPLLEIDGKALSVASYNVENLSRFDDQSRIKKIGCQIVEDLHSPDIVILHEVLDDSGTQDDGVVTANKNLKAITEAINACGGPNYAYSDNPPQNNSDGGVPGGNIRTCLLYLQQANLSLDVPNIKVDGFAINTGKIEVGNNPYRLFIKNNYFNGTRKPAMWLFTWEGEQFLVMGVHLVSQSANTPDWGNLQPPEKPEEQKRENQMNLIKDYIQKLQWKDDELNIILAGDFNDYPWSETLKILKDNQTFSFPTSQAATENFSYIHEGNAFQFDYIVVNQNLNNRIKQYSVIHLNSLYDSENQVSDHDPVLIELSKK